MKILLLVLVACSHLVESTNWAVLVAGATGYDNYRHQANVCHAYHLLINNGIAPENIITLMYDDVAYNRRNPFKGNIINEAGGPNVYKGTVIDYRGRDCNVQNLLNVLQGIPTHAGSGRVLNSKEGDHVFVYYSDHGNTDFVMMPGGRVLYSHQLNDALKSMHSKKMFSKLVFYMEACHSGSMFATRLPKDINVYAMTAANPYESSYSCFVDHTRHTPLCDQFSIAWMHDTEGAGLRDTLVNQYERVKREVSRYSHPRIYGDINGMGAMKVGQFVSNNMQQRRPHQKSNSTGESTRGGWLAYEVPYMSLLHQLEYASTTKDRLDIVHQLITEQKVHLAIDQTNKDIVRQLSLDPATLFSVKEIRQTEEQDFCYESSVDKYLQTCTKYQEYDYAMKDLYVFANICNRGKSIPEIQEAIQTVCSA